MTSSHPSAVGAAADPLDGAKDEHQRVSGWLDRLHSCRAEVPPSALERLEADYLQRLNAVVGRVAAHVAELKDAAAAQEARLSGAADRQAVEQLRHRVGEIDADELASRIAAHEAAMTEAAHERLRLEKELGPATALLQELRGHPAPASPAAEVAFPAPAPTAAAPTHEMFPEWGSPAGSGAPAVPALAADIDVEDGLDFLQHLPASEAIPAGEAARRQVSTYPAPAPGDGRRRSPGGRSAAGGGGAASAKRSGPPAAPVYRATLVCGSCGGVNDPQAWYCDGCGGELG